MRTVAAMPAATASTAALRPSAVATLGGRISRWRRPKSGEPYVFVAESIDPALVGLGCV